MAKIIDFDQDVEEYFSFKIMGHLYSFKHLNGEEMDELRSLELQDKTQNEENQKNGSDVVSDKSSEYLYSFIRKDEEKAPDFTDLLKKMILPLRVKFQKKLLAEMTGNANV